MASARATFSALTIKSICATFAMTLLTALPSTAQSVDPETSKVNSHRKNPATAPASSESRPNLVVILVNDQPWYAMTFWTMLAGIVMVVPTAVIGLMDYAKVLRRQHPGSQTATIHMIVNVVGTMFFFLSLILRGGPGPLSMGVRALTFLLAMFGLSVLALGAFLGGQLVYHHGIGVDPDGDRPAVGHGDRPVPSH